MFYTWKKKKSETSNNSVFFFLRVHKSLHSSVLNENPQKGIKYKDMYVHIMYSYLVLYLYICIHQMLIFL